MMRNRSLPANRSSERKRRQRGSEMIEFTLSFLPMLMIMFLILAGCGGLPDKDNERFVVTSMCGPSPRTPPRTRGR